MYLFVIPEILGIISCMLRFGSRTASCQHPSFDTSQLEWDNALIILVVYVQHQCFISKVNWCFKDRQACFETFCKLSPFLDNRSSVRVGGCLMLSQLEFEFKHPLLLPIRHLLKERIIEAIHYRNLHPGYKTLSCLLLEQFWILSPRRAILRHSVKGA